MMKVKQYTFYQNTKVPINILKYTKIYTKQRKSKLRNWDKTTHWTKQKEWKKKTNNKNREKTDINC